MHVLCRSLAQLREVARRRRHERLRRLPGHPRVPRGGRSSPAQHGATIFLATPRIQKPDEMGIFRALAKHGADGILVRNLAGLRVLRRARHPVRRRFLAQRRQRADASTTCASSGAERVTASYDLNRDQLLDLVAAVPPRLAGSRHPPAHADVPHGALRLLRGPLAGHEQDQLRPAVRRARGEAPRPRRHGAPAARPTSAAATRSSTPCRKAAPKSCPQLLAARRARISASSCSTTRGRALAELLDLYRDLLAGDVTGKEVWTRLKAANRVGVTRGTLEERRNPLAIV